MRQTKTDKPNRLSELQDKIAAEWKCLEGFNNQIEALEQKKFNHYVNLGRLFIEIRNEVGHGNFGPWLALHYKYITQKTVENWMRVARNQKDLEEAAKSKLISDLTLTKALKWLQQRDKPKPKPKDKDLLEDLAALVKILMKSRTTFVRIEKKYGPTVWQQETDESRLKKNKLCAMVEKSAVPLMVLLTKRFPTKHADRTDRVKTGN